MVGKMKIRKDDKVYVISGKDKGKSGKVLKIIPQSKMVVVEGVNIVKKTVKGSKKNPQGGIIEKSAPMNISNVQILCANCNKSARVGIKGLKNGKKERVCKKCGHEIKE